MFMLKIAWLGHHVRFPRARQGMPTSCDTVEPIAREAAAPSFFPQKA